jgi:hypothetical protein
VGADPISPPVPGPPDAIRRRTTAATLPTVRPMTIAAHAARFSPQYALDLAPEPLPPASTPTIAVLEHPTRAALAAAARENEFVRAFIAEGLLTWSAERVERDPPCCLVYEHGEVVGGLSDLPSMVRHAEKRKGLGDRIGIRALRPDEEVLPYNIGLRWGPTHPRRKRWEQRMALKSLLSRRDRRAVTWAMRRNQRDFVAWASEQPGLRARVADATGLTIEAFWRAVRGREG